MSTHEEIEKRIGEMEEDLAALKRAAEILRRGKAVDRGSLVFAGASLRSPKPSRNAYSGPKVSDETILQIAGVVKANGGEMQIGNIVSASGRARSTVQNALLFAMKRSLVRRVASGIYSAVA